MKIGFNYAQAQTLKEKGQATVAIFANEPDSKYDEAMVEIIFVRSDEPLPHGGYFVARVMRYGVDTPATGMLQLDRTERFEQLSEAVKFAEDLA